MIMESKDQTRTTGVPIETPVATKRAILLKLGTGRNQVLILVILYVVTSLDSFFYPESRRNSVLPSTVTCFWKYILPHPGTL
jgi:hypothetical protein